MSRKKGNLSKQIIRRAWAMFSFSIIIYSFLTYRLTAIQILESDKYKEKSERQSIQKVDLNSGRGIIYDRNGKPLTDNVKEEVMIVEKERFINDSQVRKLVQECSKMKIEDIYLSIQKQLKSQIFQIKVEDLSDDMKEKLLEKNIIVQERTLRYSSDWLLSHTIGYIKRSDKVGESGIEKAMNNILKDSNEKYLSAFKAGASGNTQDLGILKGSIKTVNEVEDAKHIKLTIDKDIQKKVEQIVDTEENPTSVVISDVDTGEILCMSSRPNFDQNDVAKYIQSKEGELVNRTVQSIYPPGSVFKIVVLYAALEQGVIDENYTYNCTGKTIVGSNGKVLNCHKKEGHGIENLQQAFSNSCNTAFFDIATKVGEDKIIEYAKKLHLDEPVNIGIDEEKNREIPTDIKISNLAIGQGSLGFTPLQINQMTQIVANNGTYKPLYLYDSIVNNDKNIVKSFRSSKSEEIISPYTITIVKEMMKGVSKDGTGKDLKDLKDGCGVKTGTAQSTSDGKKVNHGWITGFYPEERPKYAITVLVEGTEKNSKSAVPIFKEICIKLSK
ncbi:peptidoglycan D,D-transpeptidase FtsI family protein [Romboutsia sp.]|uniref:peptidoglycan D,D-transpeptidase FtsI family protein n=1 Tax=Romboutsia sp. TaxID=1965302 RepID=UPI002B93350F|nr:penicillin-binding transpeptidase domain-containing protein [Romboutsia sp.]HSQ88424.1 penicillin-binding transpeptidase domain-containing protein [Romboutsia sp.]